VVARKVEVWRGRGYEHLLYNQGGARQAIQEGERSVAVVLVRVIYPGYHGPPVTA
jgi:hypothetical protein